MLRPKKLVAVAILAVAMLIGATTTAHAETVTEALPLPARMMVVDDNNLFADQVHEQAYLTYLVKEYSPETLADWEKALAERKELGGRVVSSVTGGLIAFAIMPTQASESAEGSPQEIVIAKGNPDPSGPITIREGTVASDGNTLVIRQAVPHPLVLSHDLSFQDQIELKQQFTAAVAQQDAAMIKSVLAKLLERYQQQNHLLRQIQTIYKCREMMTQCPSWSVQHPACLALLNLQYPEAAFADRRGLL